MTTKRNRSQWTRLIGAGAVLLLAALLAGVGQTLAAQGTPMHPTFPLLDEDGRNVLRH